MLWGSKKGGFLDLFKNSVVLRPPSVIWDNAQRASKKVSADQLSFDDLLAGVSANSAAAVDGPPVEKRIPATRNYRITEVDKIGVGSVKQKYADNVAAIKLLKLIESLGREATVEEKAVLVKYCGWGGIPQVFDRWNHDWEKEYKEVKELLDVGEYGAAKASTPNAHYTPPLVIKFIYDVLARIGFKGGRIVEPALGIGHFFGVMPAPFCAESKLSAVEMDSLSGRIAKLLYRDADIRIMGFEDAKYPDNFFDLAVSNVPFGNYKVFDPRYTKFKWSIHDYFFGKTIDLVRPGGVMAFITSRFTLDKKDSGLRKYLFERADLIGAVRLPNTAFKEIANTDVTTDLIVLRKRHEGMLPGSCSWVDTKPYKIKKGLEEDINQYYSENPHMMLGELCAVSSVHGKDQVTLKPDKRSLEEALKDALGHFPEALLKDSRHRHAHAQEDLLPAPEALKEGAFTVVAGSLYVNTGGALTLCDTSAAKAKRIEGLIAVRDAAKALLCDELTSSEDSAVELRRLHLNSVYDRFVLRHGYINSRENRSAFSEDPDYPLVLSLEFYDEDTQKARKADIFLKRVIHPTTRVQRAATAQEALLVALNETGKVDFGRMQELTGIPFPDLQRELEGMVFLNPEGGWEPADEYLSGDVRKKLEVAETAAVADAQFSKNAEALKAVQPKPLEFHEITANIGSSWLPTADVKTFIEELLKMPGSVSVEYSAIIGTWTVGLEGAQKWAALESVENTNTWGTSRCNGIELIEGALNHRIPTVKDPDPVDPDKYVVNVAETEAAREKQYLIKQRFKEWIWEDQARRQRLTELYNGLFNNLRPRTFDGSHLTLPGMSSHVTLRPHQKDAVWRIIQTGNTLLAQHVGSGKTFVNVAAAMEMKRLGLVSKPMIAVPNHLLEQWGGEFLRLYPLATVLIAGKEDCTPLKRGKLMAKIATNNWDAVIITHSSFEKLPMSKEAVARFMQQRIDELEEAILSAREGKSDSRIVKELEKAKKRLTAKMKERLNVKAKDKAITFEELGTDMVQIDEADLFKNLGFTTKMTRVAGLPNTESNRAFDLYVKSQWMFERKYPVVFGTGTPVSNTMAELYTMQRYLQPDKLKQYGIYHFDSWAGTFGEIVTSLEIAPDGSGYRLRTRFARFTNLPELLQIFGLVADVKTRDMLGLEQPEIEGGKAQTVVAQASKDQKKYVESLVARAEAIRRGKVNPKKDNMLKITTDGRKAALDMRLILSSLGDFPGSKTNLAVQRIYDIWEQTSSMKSTQLVFCDLSTPKSIEFNVYSDIKTKLVAMGIPDNEIAFIHEANTDLKKKVLFFKVNSGSIRILMGSTEKMGAGMNVQRLLRALHHIDVPWRPRDIDQREGRILRQGNENESVWIYRYVTQGTFDAYSWQTVESKARFIAQIMTGRLTIRTAEDIEGAVLTYAEVKALASGNPMVLKKFKLDMEVKRLQTLHSQHRHEKYRMENEISHLVSHIESVRENVVHLESDLAIRSIPKKFSMTLDGVVYTERKDAGSAIMRRALFLRGMSAWEEVGNYAGFPLYVRSIEGWLSQNVVAKGAVEHPGTVADTELGTIASLEYALKNIENRLVERRKALAEAEKRLEGLRKELLKPFPHEETLKSLLHEQYEIDKKLDLDKREATGGLGEEEEVKKAA
jgi:N12 class adenine-specific DNA methylase